MVARNLPRGNWILDEDIPINHDLRLYGEFNGKSREYMQGRLREFLEITGLEYDEVLFNKAMYLVQDGLVAFEGEGNARMDGIQLSDEEHQALQLDEVQRKKIAPGREGPEPDSIRSADVNRGYSSWNIKTGKWDLRSGMWRLVIFCALGAVVQGWDQAAINGAQFFFLRAFNLQLENHSEIIGLVNGAPYLCCVFSCCLTPYLNRKFGRRGTIFWTAIFSAVFALLQGFAQSWQALFAYRFLLGLGIGPKSATIPIYASESAPHNIRGSLVMLWQLFTAFGIMLGSISGVAFQKLGDVSTARCASNAVDSQVLLSYDCSMNWRFMLASPMVAPAILAIAIWTQPESPRWKIARGHKLRLRGMKNRARRQYQEAFEAFRLLRRTHLQAARDMFAVFFLLQRDQEDTYRMKDNPQIPSYRRGVGQLLFVQRNRRALFASLVCMFAQQLCGVNAIVYYSTTFFQKQAPSEGGEQNPTSPGFPPSGLDQALYFSMGFGIINALFGLPAFFTIDAIGRRALLLFTFPFLSLFQFLTAVAIKYNSTKMLWVTVYLFGIFYSPGEGPVPFVYAAESMPLYIRDLGMGVATSINWLFNWVIAITFPVLYIRFNARYAPFIWYGGWCIILWFMIFFLVPETRQLSLEQLDEVFGKKTSKEFADHALEKARYNTRRLLGLEVGNPPLPFYAPSAQRDPHARSTSVPSSETYDEGMEDLERRGTDSQIVHPDDSIHRPRH